MQPNAMNLSCYTSRLCRASKPCLHKTHISRCLECCRLARGSKERRAHASWHLPWWTFCLMGEIALLGSLIEKRT